MKLLNQYRGLRREIYVLFPSLPLGGRHRGQEKTQKRLKHRENRVIQAFLCFEKTYLQYVLT